MVVVRSRRLRLRSFGSFGKCTGGRCLILGGSRLASHVPILWHDPQIPLHLLDFLGNVDFDLLFVLLVGLLGAMRRPDVLGDHQTLLILDLLLEYACAIFARLQALRLNLGGSFQIIGFLDSSFAVVQLLRQVEVEDLTAFGELVELDFDLLEQRNLIARILLLDLSSAHQLIDGSVDRFDLLTTGAKSLQVRVES